LSSDPSKGAADKTVPPNRSNELGTAVAVLRRAERFEPSRLGIVADSIHVPSREEWPGASSGAFGDCRGFSHSLLDTILRRAQDRVQSTMSRCIQWLTHSVLLIAVTIAMIDTHPAQQHQYYTCQHHPIAATIAMARERSSRKHDNRCIAPCTAAYRVSEISVVTTGATINRRASPSHAISQNEQQPFSIGRFSSSTV